MPDAVQLVPGFRPETPLEATLAGDPDLVQGLAWGRPRKGHPEGSVGTHVGDLLAELDRQGVTGETRETLRFLALVHDSFKYRVRDWLPKTGSNHHAARARRFAQQHTDDERILATLELHDRPYNLWRKMRRKGRLDHRGFEHMMSRIPDPQLFLHFIELDGSTDGKHAEPIDWFHSELTRRLLIEPGAPPDARRGADPRAEAR